MEDFSPLENLASESLQVGWDSIKNYDMVSPEGRWRWEEFMHLLPEHVCHVIASC